MRAFRFALALPVFLCVVSFPGCGDDKSNPVQPNPVAVSKDEFIGQWNGSVLAELSFESLESIPQNYQLKNMPCRLEFTLFRYELVMQKYEEGRTTIYKQIGDWSWSADNPGALVFHDDSTTLHQELEISGGLRKSTYGTMTKSYWSCEVGFATADLTDLMLKGFDPELRLLDAPDTIAILLHK